MVGDDAQSIYSFRGANIDNILNFQSQYKGAKLFKLEQNYRSTQLIVQAANSLIRRNERQIPKNVYSRNEHGERLQLKPAYSDKEEAMIVTQDIKRLRRQDHCNWSDFAILYRTNSQSRSFEEQMRKEAIPYRIYGGLSFYQRKEIKDVIAYFRLIANPNDEEAFKRIVNYPARGIGDTTIGKIIQTAQTYGVSLWQVIKEPVLFPMDVSKGTMTKLQNFRELIESWMGRIASEDAYTLGHDIIMNSGISKDIYSGRNPEDISRQENLEEFLSGMQDFVESRKEEDMGDQIYLPDFLQEVALLTDLDSDNGDSNDKVTLMTIHSAKGLEFPTVFVVGLEENIFPSPMCTNSMRELEEERSDAKKIEAFAKLADGNLIREGTLHDFPAGEVVEGDADTVGHAFDMDTAGGGDGIDVELSAVVLVNPDVITGTHHGTHHNSALFAAGLPGSGNIDEVVLGVVDGGVEAHVQEAAALLHDADVKHAVEADAPIELIVGKTVDLLIPLGFPVGETVHLVARFAVVVFPYHNVEILVVGIVEGMVEKNLYTAQGVKLGELEFDSEAASG